MNPLVERARAIAAQAGNSHGSDCLREMADAIERLEKELSDSRDATDAWEADWRDMHKRALAAEAKYQEIFDNRCATLEADANDPDHWKARAEAAEADAAAAKKGVLTSDRLKYEHALDVIRDLVASIDKFGPKDQTQLRAMRFGRALLADPVASHSSRQTQTLSDQEYKDHLQAGHDARRREDEGS